MDEGTVGLIDDLPLFFTDLQTEIDILKPVPKAFVESIHLLKNATAHEHAGCGDALQFPPPGHTGGIGATATIHMVGHQEHSRENATPAC